MPETNEVFFTIKSHFTRLLPAVMHHIIVYIGAFGGTSFKNGGIAIPFLRMPSQGESVCTASLETGADFFAANRIINKMNCY